MTARLYLGGSRQITRGKQRNTLTCALCRQWRTDIQACPATSYKIPHLIINNAHYSVPFEVATQFALHYSNVSATTQYPPHLHATLNARLEALNFLSTNTESYNLPFKIYELKLALSKCGNTSVGPDQLAYPFFKNLTEPGLLNLLFGFNQIWTAGSFPDSWKESIMIPILKPSKLPTDPASYRPISLSSCASKILEKMVNGRLRTYIDTNQLLSPYQTGFRPGHSTADGLARLIDTAQKSLQIREVTVALFLDLKAAFDKVHHSALLIKLHQLGIRGRLATYIQNFLTQRRFSVRCGKTLSPLHDQEHGVPQGCVISPTLFQILINDIGDNLSNVSPHIQYTLYADDIAIWYSHPSVDFANGKIQRALNQISRWCSRWGLQISPAKSATLIFSHRTKLQPATPLNVQGENIPLVQTYKFLGITLDCTLSFKHHILDIKKRCSRRLNILKCIAGRDWGADRSTLLRLYTSLIRPILDYNAFLFDTISDTHVSSLEAVQNAALRIATGALRTTPTVNLHAETNIPPLQFRRKYLLLRFYLRTLSRPMKPIFKHIEHLPGNQCYTMAQRKHPSLAMSIQNAIDLFHFPPIPIMSVPGLRPYWTRHAPTVEYLFTDNKSSLIPAEIHELFNTYLHKHNNYFFIYTDGSRNNDRAGAAFYCRSLTRSRRLSDYYSIYSAELSAILSALVYITHKRIPRSIICSDSKSSLQALSSFHNSSHPLIDKILTLLNNIPGLEIKFLWIPGHADILGNTHADKAAKHSLLLPENNAVLCPVSDGLNVLHDKFRRFLQRDWDITNHYYFHPIKPKLGHWSSSFQNTRLKEIILARLRLGHTKLTHSHLIENRRPSQCHRCRVPYTIPHFLFVCPLYHDQRQNIIRHVTANRLPLTLPLTLGDSNPDLLALLFAFLHETRLENFI